MPHPLHRLSTKLLLLTFGFLALLGIATALLVSNGFHQTQVTATQASAAGLEGQGREALGELTQREAQINITQFQQAVTTGHIAAEHMIAMARRGAEVPATRRN